MTSKRRESSVYLSTLERLISLFTPRCRHSSLCGSPRFGGSITSSYQLAALVLRDDRFGFYVPVLLRFVPVPFEADQIAREDPFSAAPCKKGVLFAAYGENVLMPCPRVAAFARRSVLVFQIGAIVLNRCVLDLHSFPLRFRFPRMI